MKRRLRNRIMTYAIGLIAVASAVVGITDVLTLLKS